MFRFIFLLLILFDILFFLLLCSIMVSLVNALTPLTAFSYSVLFRVFGVLREYDRGIEG